LHDHDLRDFINAGLAVLRQIRDELKKQTAAQQSIAASLQSDEATSLVLTLGKPEPQE